jgi:hypothetical protein
LVEAMPTTWHGLEGFDLIDRTDGRRTPLRLPEGEQWLDVSVCPWRGRGGEVEAVGRWVNPGRDDFNGWAIFRPSDGTVLSRVATEILPTGRPCWVPGSPRTILYAGADGQLCRCLLAEDEPSVGGRLALYASGHAEPSDPVAWEVPPPGPGQPVVTDPFWSTDPRVRRWVFVAIMALEHNGGRPQYGLNRLWWLELSDDASRIVAAGPVIEDNGGETESDEVERRFPNVAVGPDGHSRLVFLERRDGTNIWRLRSAPLEFDAKTGRPRAVASRPGPDPESEVTLQPAPLLLSADGATVYGLSASGRLGAWPVGPRGDRSRTASRADGRTPGSGSDGPLSLR